MSRRARRAARFCLLATLTALTSACYPARAGFWPSERLPALRPGVSSKAEVETVLGTPLGRGAARFTPEMPRREVWVYAFFEYSGASLSTDLGQLIVFFDGGRFDGYFWTNQGGIAEPGRGASRR